MSKYHHDPLKKIRYWCQIQQVGKLQNILSKIMSVTEVVNLQYFLLSKERETEKKKYSGMRAYDKSQVIVTQQLSLKHESEKDK